MKQFSLEEYRKNPDRKIVTRNGGEVRILCTDRKSAIGLPPILALVKNGEGNEELFGFCTNGEYLCGGSSENNKDLFFAPKKYKGWANVYKYGNYYCTGESIFDTEEEAKECTGQVATVKIEWED